MPMTPAVPALAAHDEQVVGADVWIGLDDLPRRSHDARFLFLSPGVLVVQLRRERPRDVHLVLVDREQQPSGDVRRAHPPGGVDARREHEPDVEPVERLPEQARRLEQGAQPDRVRAPREAFQTELGDDTVLADERDDVGHRADGGNLHERRQPLLAPFALAQRLHELERDADAGEVLVGVAAIVALGIDDRERGRELRFGFVMVADDEIEPELARAPRRRAAADAAVDRHERRSPRRRAVAPPRASAGRSRRAIARAGSARPCRRAARSPGAG